MTLWILPGMVLGLFQAKTLFSNYVEESGAMVHTGWGHQLASVCVANPRNCCFGAIQPYQACSTQHQAWILGFKLNVEGFKAESKSTGQHPPTQEEDPDWEDSPRNQHLRKAKHLLCSQVCIVLAGGGKANKDMGGGRQQRQMAKQVIGLGDNRGRDIDVRPPKCPFTRISIVIQQSIALYWVTPTLVQCQVTLHKTGCLTLSTEGMASESGIMLHEICKIIWDTKLMPMYQISNWTFKLLEKWW